MRTRWMKKIHQFHSIAWCPLLKLVLFLGVQNHIFISLGTNDEHIWTKQTCKRCTALLEQDKKSESQCSLLLLERNIFPLYIKCEKALKGIIVCHNYILQKWDKYILLHDNLNSLFKGKGSMLVLGKKIRNTKELLGHLPHRTQMIASRKLLIFFLDFNFFLMCFKVIKLGELNFKGYSTVVESAKKNFLIIRLNFLILCVNFLFFLCYCYYHLK